MLMKLGEWLVQEERRAVNGNIDILEFSFGELDDLQIEVQLPEEKDLLQQDKLRIIQDMKKFLQPVREKLLNFEQELKDRQLVGSMKSKCMAFPKTKNSQIVTILSNPLLPTNFYKICGCNIRWSKGMIFPVMLTLCQLIGCLPAFGNLHAFWYPSSVVVDL
ncbi:hypothetical protein SLEP1_g13101 [Rubroshorea leprosula]|uniref:Activator of Hsp90 ATPase AHSA1-like N-terminal domain-containing protein n=1 Tax=Rubroshorea leprosula TaxID=152421 RepID=A0AAV5IR56_9ROSI|nr:hypothetical protein SLEP1_g13101 [Rubroshorea leprosula]